MQANPSIGRFQTNQATTRRREADTAAGIGTDGREGHPSGYGNAGPRGRDTGPRIPIPRIQRRLYLRMVRAKCPLGQLRFTDEHGTCIPQACDYRCIEYRTKIFHHHRAGGCG